MTRIDFEQLEIVLNRKVPNRPVLFEFYMNEDIYKKYGGSDPRFNKVKAFFELGYDYALASIWSFEFPQSKRDSQASISQNDGVQITNRKDFENYAWPTPNYKVYKEIQDELDKHRPVGGKFIGHLPQSILGGLVRVFGYENLCLLFYDDPELVRDVADAFGKILLKHTEIICSFDSFGAIILNDDWGDKNQLRITPQQMREYIIPWYQKMAEIIHQSGKYAIQHSCGNMWSLIDDICDVIKMDGKHSYEDIILPVEEAWEKYSSRIAIMGGIDVDFLCRRSPKEIYQRSKAMLERTSKQGAYALGSGNSIPKYVPEKNYLAMLSAAKNNSGRV